MSHPPRAVITAMAVLFVATLASVFLGMRVPAALIIAIVTGVAFIGCAAWMIFTMPRERPTGWRAERFRRVFACPKCGYSRQGLEVAVCPECGYDIAKREEEEKEY